MREDVTVIIRSTNERTESCCMAIVAKQVPAGNIVIIHETPFSKAVKTTFATGVDRNKKWTLAVDADILLTRNAVAEMIGRAELKPSHTFVYQGCVLDRLFNDIRPGGPHLYRTSLLQQAIEHIPTDSDNLRPESYTYSKMAAIGFHFYQESEIYGVHDYEQYKRDLYRKSFVHAKKHTHLTKHFIWEWSRGKDPDHAIAIAGFIEGLSYEEKIMIDHNFFGRIIENGAAEFIEKPELKQLPDDFVAKIIAAFRKTRADAVNLDRFRKSTFVRKPNLFLKFLWYGGLRIEKFGKMLKRNSRMA